MKGFGFTTILFGFVLIKLLISFVLIAFTMYKISSAAEYVIDSSTNTVTKKGVSAKEFWASNKLMFIIPSVSNVLSMILLGVLIVTY